MQAKRSLFHYNSAVEVSAARGALGAEVQVAGIANKLGDAQSTSVKVLTFIHVEAKPGGIIIFFSSFASAESAVLRAVVSLKRQACYWPRKALQQQCWTACATTKVLYPKSPTVFHAVVLA